MKVQITSGMFLALIINVVFAKAIGVTQSMIVAEAEADMWLSTTFAALQGLALMLITVCIIRRAPAKDMMDNASMLMGSWAGKLVALILFVFFLGAFGGIMITLVYHLKDYFLPETPTYIFIACALAVGLYGAYLGIEVMGRMAYVGLFGIIALNFLIMLGTLDDFDIRNIMPVFDEGLAVTALESRHHTADMAMASLMAAIVLPTVKEPKKWGSAAASGIFFSWLFVVIWPILEAGVLSSASVKQYFVACMQLARSARLGYFVQRYELIMIAFFGVSCIIQVIMGLFCASHAVSKIFNLKDYRPMLIPSALILGGFSYWVVEDHMRAHELLYTYWPWLSLPIAFGLPLLLWGLGFVIKKKK